MRLATTLCLLGLACPAMAAAPPAGSVFATGTILSSTHFSAWDRIPDVHDVAVAAAPLPSGSLREALVSATNVVERRDMAVNELAADWDPARRASLEDLRDAQRAYAAAPGGDREARDRRFVALLKQVVEGSGRSAARQPKADGDVELHEVYGRVIRDMPDEKLVAVQASEAAWVVYRDAFDRFAQIMDRPDAANAARDDLATQRAAELLADAESK